MPRCRGCCGDLPRGELRAPRGRDDAIQEGICALRDQGRCVGRTGRSVRDQGPLVSQADPGDHRCPDLDCRRGPDLPDAAGLRNDRAAAPAVCGAKRPPTPPPVANSFVLTRTATQSRHRFGKVRASRYLGPVLQTSPLRMSRPEQRPRGRATSRRSVWGWCRCCGQCWCGP